jgi:tripartite-type tricarboxylate transporter receptor subunit TctC
VSVTRRAFLVAALSASTVARAQGKYPERSIKLIGPYPPGGGVDLTVRC